jgi:hypothetical protein
MLRGQCGQRIGIGSDNGFNFERLRHGEDPLDL